MNYLLLLEFVVEEEGSKEPEEKVIVRLLRVLEWKKKGEEVEPLLRQVKHWKVRSGSPSNSPTNLASFSLVPLRDQVRRSPGELEEEEVLVGSDRKGTD